MNRAILLLLTLGLSLAPVLCWAAEPKTEEAKAIAEIEKLGGKVTRDEKKLQQALPNCKIAPLK